MATGSPSPHRATGLRLAATGPIVNSESGFKLNLKIKLRDSRWYHDDTATATGSNGLAVIDRLRVLAVPGHCQCGPGTRTRVQHSRCWPVAVCLREFQGARWNASTAVNWRPTGIMMIMWPGLASHAATPTPGPRGRASEALCKRPRSATASAIIMMATTRRPGRQRRLNRDGPGRRCCHWRWHSAVAPSKRP